MAGLSARERLEHIEPGTRAEVVLDVLPGRVLPARVRHRMGCRRRRCRCHDRPGEDTPEQRWMVGAGQRFPVQLMFETAEKRPRGVRYNARASVILYTG